MTATSLKWMKSVHGTVWVELLVLLPLHFSMVQVNPTDYANCSMALDFVTLSLQRLVVINI